MCITLHGEAAGRAKMGSREEEDLGKCRAEVEPLKWDASPEDIPDFDMHKKPWP